MAVEAQGDQLVQVVALLGAGVVAVPIFRRLGLGSVLGYFAAGLAIGPFGLGLFSDPESILHVAELGVIMLLFIIGLEMQPARLWALRGQIFGLGIAHVAVCAALLTVAGMAVFGFSGPAAFVAGAGFVLSSTAAVTQMLDERGEMSTPEGQKTISILLLEDLAIVPLLALVAFMAPRTEDADVASRLIQMGYAIGAVVGIVVAGRFLLNPMFRLLAAARAREVMTAAALLVVLGAALLMQIGGLSMAMGAFLAGVLLSESSFRNQLEADVEPFRGLLLGLFFLAVGMSLDVDVIARAWPMILAVTAVYILTSAIGIYGVAAAFGASQREAINRIVMFAQGGEFAFVLYGAALASGIFDRETNAILTAAVILSMALAPFSALALRRVMPPEKPSMEGVELAHGLSGTALIIGFGRFGQVVSQGLLARGCTISIIEIDVEMIRAASDFGFLVHYGDGTRLDILHASGAGRADMILVCVDKRETSDRIVELIQSEFPLAKLLVRAWDRGHAIDLINKNVDFQIRDTFESALVFGQAALENLGVPEDEAAEIISDVRRRDLERLDIQIAGGIYAGQDLMLGNAPRPGPLTRPRQQGRVVGAEMPPVEAS
ncbi:monovalent cation:proton antiporter-2 (CPA2) family protein [Flaviflagellibacter deserti]|uniref:Monovalent cation:proton antiporter-2 (CPA2) family protein n=1 Tax=Flaviflagellibacter deserti TaxID=2267266 RepID=A0ABV9Z5V3_9HYPH